MNKNNIKTTFFVLTSLVAFNEGYINAGCISLGCKNLGKFSINTKRLNERFLNTKQLKSLNISFNDNFLINKRLGKELHELDKFINSILIANNEKDNNSSDNFEYQIESDSQYLENDIFYAEGNVNILLPNGILNADKISYDKFNKIFKAYSNLNVSKGNQFFKADYLEYNFTKSKGYIENIYGIIDSLSINEDLNLQNNPVVNNFCKNETLDLYDLPSEVEFLDSANERYKNQIGLDKLKFDFSAIKNWRFKSKRIDLKGNQWFSDLVDFTNDPFNKPQLIVRSKNFVGEIINSRTKLTSNLTKIILEDKFVVPIIGKRTISDEVSKVRWGLGYDYGDKDGLYIMRRFDTINFDEDKDFTLEIQPYFLIQRAIKGKSKSFRKTDSSIFSDNFEKNIGFLDYFALNSLFKGKINQWNLEIDSKLKTLNSENFYDAFSSKLNLVRNLYNFSTVSDCENLLKTKDEYDNFSVNLGFYSIFDKDDIYTSFGTKLLGNYNYKRKSFNKLYDIVFDFGQYQAKSKDKTENNNYLKKLDRYGVTTSLSHKYKILEFNKNSDFNFPDNKYSPIKPEQGLFINARIGAGLYEYSDNTSQSFLSMSLGSNFSYGNLKRNVFDYTSISIFPEFIIKNGESPFAFDNFNNDSRIKFSLKQQLLGPLLLGIKGDYNINTDSSKFATFQNKIISLNISRRAYSIGLSYDEDDKSVFLGFEIFNFGDTKFNNEF